jgi:hypothetical protein
MTILRRKEANDIAVIYRTNMVPRTRNAASTWVRVRVITSATRKFQTYVPI